MSAEIKGLTNEQIGERLAVRERDLVAARFALAANQLENTATLGEIRKEIAQLRTEARSREIASSLGKGSIGSRRPKSGAKAGQPAQAPTEKGGFLKGIVDKLTTNE